MKAPGGCPNPSLRKLKKEEHYEEVHINIIIEFDLSISFGWDAFAQMPNPYGPPMNLEAAQEGRRRSQSRAGRSLDRDRSSSTRRGKEPSYIFVGWHFLSQWRYASGIQWRAWCLEARRRKGV